MTSAELGEEVRAMDTTERDFLRDAAKNDLYILAKGVLGYPDINKDTHGGFCRFFEAPPVGSDGVERLRRLGLMPRGHLKSTIATVADSIRLVLQEPDYTRVLIANETVTLAKKFLFEIKGHWEKNQVLRGLFPELVPTRLAGPGVQWSDERASINRNTAHKEPNWSAIGVGGSSVGAHFTRVKCDDLIGFDAAFSPAAMKYAIAWNGNIESLLVDQHEDMIDWIGTRWSKNDLYFDLMEKYGQAISVYTRQAIEGGEIIFPGKHTWEEYRRLQQNEPAVWHAQYENNPRSTENKDFNDRAVRTFALDGGGETVIGNPGQTKEVRWRIDQLDVCLLADPNSGSLSAPDAASVVVVGLSPKDEVFVLSAWSGRVSPSDFVDKIFTTSKRWKPRVVGIEKAGQQNTQHYFERKSREESKSFRVEPLKPKNRDKVVRIRTALQPIISSGRLYLLPSQTTLRGQIADFPDNLLVDELDALAYGPEVWRTPYKVETLERARKNINLILARRNLRTGY